MTGTRDFPTMATTFPELADDQLLAFYAGTKEELERQRQVMDHLHRELRKRAEQRGADAIMGKRYTARFTTTVSYMQGQFAPLKEIFQEADLAKCLVPEHQETITVEDNWTTATVLALAKRYGAAALAVVAQARVEGEPRLVFKERVTPGAKPASTPTGGEAA